MKIGRIIALVLGVACLVVAVVYLVSPETIGGPLQEGEMLPQFNMPGDAVSTSFTTIPLGIGTLTVPVLSAVVIFAIVGIALVYTGIAQSRRVEGGRST